MLSRNLPPFLKPLPLILTVNHQLNPFREYSGLIVNHLQIKLCLQHTKVERVYPNVWPFRTLKNIFPFDII